MSRFDNSPIPYGEPAGLAQMYALFESAEKVTWAVEDTYPSILQTPAYAEGVIAFSEAPPEMASARMAARVGRIAAFAAAGIEVVACIPEKVLTSQHYVSPPTVLLGQLAHLRSVVGAGIKASQASRLQVGIVPAQHFTPTFPGQSVLEVITREKERYILANDGLLVASAGSQEAKERVIQDGIELLNTLAAHAVTGEAALKIIANRREMLHRIL